MGNLWTYMMIIIGQENTIKINSMDYGMCKITRKGIIFKGNGKRGNDFWFIINIY